MKQFLILTYQEITKTNSYENNGKYKMLKIF